MDQNKAAIRAAKIWLMLMGNGSQAASKAINVKQIAKLTNFPILDDENKVDPARVKVLRDVILENLMRGLEDMNPD